MRVARARRARVIASRQRPANAPVRAVRRAPAAPNSHVSPGHVPPDVSRRTSTEKDSESLEF